MHIEQTTTPARARGSEQIAAALQGVDFPITKQELVARVGERTLVHGDTLAPLAAIVRGVPQARFRDADHAVRAVASRWARIESALAAVEELEASERAGRGGGR